jgi:hypothetical protein
MAFIGQIGHFRTGTTYPMVDGGNDIGKESITRTLAFD